ncbi:hypothetical protein [Dapis sp. BLCC M229]
MTIEEFNKRLNFCIQTFNKIYDKVKEVKPIERVIRNIVQKLKEIKQEY